MPFQSYTPAAPLGRFVESIWCISNIGVPSARQHVCPNGGAMQLVIDLMDRSLSFFDGTEHHSVRAPLLAGPYSKAFSIDPSEFTNVLGIQFKPGAARVFFQVPAHELHNADVPLEDLFPGEARQLRGELLSTRGLSRRFRVIERYLLGKLSGAAPIPAAVEHAVDEFCRNSGARAVMDVRSQIGLSHQRFIQVFREHVGLTPKLFCRLQRFRSVVRRIERGGPVKWADVAAECGYFDQAHLIHDFRSFSGLTPLAYAQGQTVRES
jgi:AraC-like DNA-binding protein